jgi:exodeoxyribonuclease VII large subunit
LDIPPKDVARALDLGAMLEPTSGRYFVSDNADLKRFSAWNNSANERSAQENYLSLTELLSRVDETLAREMSKSTWVRLEISDLKKKNGNLYLDVVDRDEFGSEISKTRANIWASQANRIEEKFHSETGTRLRAGMKILALVKVNFHVRLGFSVLITDIDPRFTLGDMEAKLRGIRETLMNLGEFTLNRDLSPPFEFFNVAVISPENAAGLGDFKIEADKLSDSGICRFNYFHATFQGLETKSSILNAFKKVHESHEIEGCDVLVLIRGGGQIDDLHWLNQLTLARLVCRIPIPVFTGIGHEKDSTILDECANRSFGTPSKVVAHIRELIFSRSLKAFEDWVDLQRKASRIIEIAESGTDQGMREFRVNSCRLLDGASNRSLSNLTYIASRVVKLETIAEGRVGLLRASILERGRTSDSMAGSSALNLMSKVNERLNGAIGNFEAKIENDFASIKLAARRSIDGIDSHIDSSSDEVISNALTRAKRVSSDSARFFEEVKKGVRRVVSEVAQDADENMKVVFIETMRTGDLIASGVEGFAGEIGRSALRTANLAAESSDSFIHDTALSIMLLLDDGLDELNRHINDLNYFAMRFVDTAEQGFKDIMSGIVAMGVEPTLKRGFAIIYSQGRPVTTMKKAEIHHSLEICFNDGRLNVTKSNY